MQQVIDFLSELALHNDREWFNAHKEDYLKAKNTFDTFACELIKGVKEFDPSIGNLTLKDCTYRIYRDLRFSKDKSPYKTHMGMFIAPGGKKSGFSGYYFHISGITNENGDYGNHMIAVGDYMTEPKVLKLIREDILLGNGDFREIMSKVDHRLYLDSTGALKKVPQGFDKDSPDAEYFKLKRFCLVAIPDQKFILRKDLVKELLKIFKSTKPYLDYINRAIEYSKEDNTEYLIDF